jgi:hypothetical protein
MDNQEKIMLFLLPLITVSLFVAAILIFWLANNWQSFVK